MLVFYPCLQGLLKIFLNNPIDGGEIHVFTAMDWIFVVDYSPMLGGAGGGGGGSQSI